jgi:hypothetical protein
MVRGSDSAQGTQARQHVGADLGFTAPARYVAQVRLPCRRRAYLPVAAKFSFVVRPSPTRGDMIKSFRRSARQILDSMHAHTIRRELRRIRAMGAATPSDVRTLHELWGNPGWSVPMSFLDAEVELLAETDGPILDLGSGLSTALAAALAPMRTVWSLEQDAHWVREMQRRLRDTNVRLFHAPLREYPEIGCMWYDLAGIDLPSRFGLVMCDGPAVLDSAAPTRSLRDAWRVGVVPVLQQRGIRFDALLADNMREPRAPAALDLWKASGLRMESINVDGVAVLIA